MKISDIHCLYNKPLIEEKIIPILDVDNNKREVHNIPDNEKNKNDMQ